MKEEITILDNEKIRDIVKPLVFDTIPIVSKFKKPILNNQSRMYDTFSQRISLNFPKLSLWEITYYSSVKEIKDFQDAGTILYTFEKDWNENDINSESIQLKNLISLKPKLSYKQPEYEIYRIQNKNLFVFKNENLTLKDLEVFFFSYFKVPSLNKSFTDLYSSLFSCFKKYTNEIINVKLKDLPQILILSQGCRFETFALKPKTIVVMEDYSTLVCEDGISGNIYLCNYSLLYQLSFNKKYIGNNIFLQDGAVVNSKYVGNNVIFGANSKAAMNTSIDSHVYVTNDVNLYNECHVPSFQTITSKSPLIIQPISATTEYNKKYSN